MYLNVSRLQRELQASKIGSRLYPNGEFTCGIIPEQKKQSEKERKYDELHALQSVVYEEWCFYRRGFEEKTIEKPAFLFYKEAEQVGSSYLANCHNEPKKTRAQRGLKGITSYQRKILRNAAWLMQRKYGKRRMAMLTLTLPTLTQEQADAILTHKGGWHDLVRKFTQEFQRELRRQKAPTCYTGCTEIQEKRWRRTGVLAPHLHILYIAHEGDWKYYVDANRFREIWRRLIQNVVDDMKLDVVVDTKAGIDCSMVKKDAVAYISKYLSKGGKLIEEIKDEPNQARIPRAWAHCSKRLKRYILDSIDTLTNDEKIAIFNGYPLEEEGYLKWLFPIDVCIDEEYVRVGYAGALAEPRHQIDESRWET